MRSSDKITHHLTKNNMTVDLYVIGVLMKGKIVSKEDGVFIIIKNGHGILH